MNSEVKTKRHLAGSFIKQWALRWVPKQWKQPHRRQFHRYPCELPIELRLDSSGEQKVIKAMARNISGGGLLIECPTILAPLTPCQVSFSLPAGYPFSRPGSQSILQEGLVRHCHESLFSFGLEFTSPLRARAA